MRGGGRALAFALSVAALILIVKVYAANQERKCSAKGGQLIQSECVVVTPSVTPSVTSSKKK